MADPTRFTPGFSYSDFETDSPTQPKPGAQLDNDMFNVAASIDTLIGAVLNVRRSDGKLNNRIVSKDSLASDVLALVAAGGTPRGDWTTATAYKAKDLVAVTSTTYIAIVDHVAAADFGTDLNAGKWLLFSSDGKPTGPDFFGRGPFDEIVAAEPEAPAVGDRVLLDETHPAHPNEIAEYDVTGWKYSGTPRSGQEGVDASTGVVYRYGGNSGEWYAVGVLLGSSPSKAAAYTAALGKGVPLLLDADYVAAADVDLSDIVIEPIGGKIVPNGHAVTIGRVGMPPGGVLFDLSLGGSVVPNGYQYAEVTPELFNAKGDGVIDDAVPLNAANTFLYKRGGGVIKCGARVYKCGSIWTIDNHVGVEGFVSVLKLSAQGAYLHVARTVGNTYVAGETAPFDTNRYNKISGIVVDCGNTADIGMKAGNIVARRFDTLVMSNYKKYGAVFAGTQNSKIDLLNCNSNGSTPYAAIQIKNGAANLDFNVGEFFGGSSTDGTPTSCVEFAIDADEGAGTTFSADHISFNRCILEFGSPQYAAFAPGAADGAAADVSARRVHWNESQLNKGSTALGLVGSGSNYWSFDNCTFNMNNVFKKGLLLKGFGTLLKKPEFINPASVSGTDACIEYWNKFRCEGWSNGVGTASYPVNQMFLNHTGGNPEDYMTFIPNEGTLSAPQTFSASTATSPYFNSTTKQWEQQISGTTYAAAALKLISKATKNDTPGTILAGALYGPVAVTVAGAQVGDIVRITPPYSLQKGVVWGVVTTATNVNMYIKNEDPANAIGAFAAGDFVVRVFREQT